MNFVIALNKQCIGKSFDEIIEIYKTSGFTTARAFAKRYENKKFTTEQIRKRSELIAKDFYDSILEFKDTDKIIKKIRLPKKPDDGSDFTQLSFEDV